MGPPEKGRKPAAKDRAQSWLPVAIGIVVMVAYSLFGFVMRSGVPAGPICGIRALGSRGGGGGGDD